jgi:hypothetical protein
MAQPLSGENKVLIIRELKNKIDQEQADKKKAQAALKQAQKELARLHSLHARQKFVTECPMYLADFTIAHVSQQLLALGLGRYVQLFEEQFIDGSVLSSGLLSKHDLQEMGMQGVHAARILAWTQGCIAAGGLVELAGRQLNEDEMVETLLHVLRCTPSTDKRGRVLDDVAITKDWLRHMVVDSPNVRKLFQACTGLCGFLDSSTFDSSFKAIDHDDIGSMSARELLKSMGVLHHQGAMCFSRRVENALMKLSGNLPAGFTITEKQLLRALVFNTHSLRDLFRHAGPNDLLKPRQFKTCFDANLRPVVTVRRITLYLLRKQNTCLPASKMDVFSLDASNVVQQQMRKFTQELQARSDERLSRLDNCFRRLLYKVEQLQKQQFMERVSPEGYQMLAKEVTLLGSRMESLEGVLRNESRISLANKLAPQETELLRHLAKDITRLESENVHLESQLVECKEIIRMHAHANSSEQREQRRLDEMRVASSNDMGSAPVHPTPSKPAGAPSTFREQSLRFKLRGSSAKIEDDEAFFSAAKKKMLRQKREKEMAKINAEKTKNYKSKSRPSKHDHHHRKIVVDDSKEQNIARAATRQLQDKSFRGIESGKIGFWDKAR